MSTEADHLDAVVAFLTTANAVPMTLQQLEDAATLPAYYTEVQVTQRLTDGPRRTDEPSERTQWRILTRAVGMRYANAQTMRTRAGALHLASLTVGGDTFHVERAVSDDPISLDDGWWSGTSEYVY